MGANTFQLEDVGSTMNEFFMKFYEAHFANFSLDMTKFRAAAMKFFDANPNDLFLRTQQFSQAEQIWDFALSTAYEWQSKNTPSRIHKGTPYYFWAVTCILNRELEKGFLLMHQALEEDKKTQNKKSPNTPAYFFVTLDYLQQNQAFREKVHEIADFMEKRLETYRSTRKSNLTLSDVRSKFLTQTDLDEEVFYFVFTLFRLENMLNRIDNRLEKNPFASLLESSTIFTLCLVLDSVIKNKNPTEWKFIDQLSFLSSRTTLTLSKGRLGKISEDFDGDFQKTLNDLLNSSYKVDGTSLQPVETDLAISYGFRNFGAHKIEGQSTVYENFEDISQRVLSALFYSIEKL